MEAIKRVTAAVNDYYHRFRVMPRRVTISEKLAKELDAEMQCRRMSVDMEFDSKSPPQLLQDGAVMSIMGVLIVADMEPKYICNIDSEVEPDARED